MIPKVNSGDKLKIRAQDWNAIANHINSTSLEVAGMPRQKGIYAYNTYQQDWFAGMTVKVKGFEMWSGADLPETWAEMQVMKCELPKADETECNLGILAEDTPSLDIGRVKLSGACYALFSNYDPTLPYAIPDGTGRLKSAPLGTIEVVYVDTKSKQGIVIIGGTGGAKGGYFDVRCEKVDGQWQATIFNSGEPEKDGNNNFYISGKVYLGSHRIYMPITSVPITGSGWLYLWLMHDGQDHTGYSPYVGISSGYAFAEKMPEAGYNERKAYFQIAYIRPRYGDVEKNGYEAVRTSHSRAGEIEITGRLV